MFEKILPGERGVVLTFICAFAAAVAITAITCFAPSAPVYPPLEMYERCASAMNGQSAEDVARQRLACIDKLKELGWTIVP